MPRALPYAWVVLLSAAITAPLLAPGFTLSYDLVFTPRQNLLPGSLGIGGGLPRAVPQDAIVAIIETVVPGSLLEKLVLVAIPLLAGWGMLRLARDFVGSTRLVAATLYTWSPYLAERLVLGHWGLLIAYAILPWAVAVALDVRRGRQGAAGALVLLLAACALTPTGTLLAGAIAVPIAIGPRSASSVGSRALVGVGWLFTCLPWLLPALLNPALSATASASVEASGAEAFALRPEGWWGALVTALGTGGVWNAEAVPASRSWPTAPVWSLVVVALAVAGWGSAVRALGRAALGWLTAVAGLGLLAALVSSGGLGGASQSAWATLVAAVPGGGIVRDSAKLLAPLALLLALLAGAGVGRALRGVREPSVRIPLVVAAAVIPIAVLPDLAWGVGGRLSPVAYPADFATVRERVSAGGPGDVIVLPWSTFRQFEWNANRTVLDPAPRWLPITSITDDALRVATPDGPVVVGGEDPRSATVARALSAGQPLIDVAGPLGAGWVLVEKGQRPEVEPASIVGLEQDFDGVDLALYRVPGPIAATSLPGGAWAVIVVDVAVLVMLAVIGGRVAMSGLRRRRHSRAMAGPGDSVPA